MPFFDTTDNQLLPFSRPPCEVCPLGLGGTCRGPNTRLSLYDPQLHGITCSDQGKIAELVLNLKRNLPRGEPVISQPHPSKLPSFVPILDRDLPPDIGLDKRLLVGVSIGSLMNPDGRLRYSSGIELRRGIGLPEGCRLCLFLTCDEQLLEALWRSSLETKCWQTFRSYELEFCTGTSFSVWSLHGTRAEQRINIERNFASMSFLASVGVPAVPFIFCVMDEDFFSAGQWLRRNPEVKIVGQYARFYKTLEKFRLLLDKMERLQSAAGRELRFLVQGCAKREKLEALFARFPDAIVATSKPFSAARSGRLLHKEDLTELAISKEQLEWKRLCPLNVQAFHQATKALTGGHLVDSPPYGITHPQEGTSAQTHLELTI